MQHSSVGCSIAILDATKLSRMQRIIDVRDGWGERRGILNFKASRSVERYTMSTLLATRSGMKGSISFWKGLSFIFVE